MLWLAIINVVAVVIVIAMAIYMYLVYRDSKKTFGDVEKKPKAKFPDVDRSITNRMYTSSNMLNTLYIGMHYKTNDLSVGRILANLHNMQAIFQSQYCSSQQLKKDLEDFLKLVRNNTKWSNFVRICAMYCTGLNMTTEDVERLLDDIKPIIVKDMSKAYADQEIDVSRLEALLDEGRKAMCDSIRYMPSAANDTPPTDVIIGTSFTTTYTPLQLFLIKLNMYYNSGIKRYVCGSEMPPPSFTSCGEIQNEIRGAYDAYIYSMSNLNPGFTGSTSNVMMNNYYGNAIGVVQNNVCASNVTVEKQNSQNYGRNMYNAMCFV
jgi:hypothetical protein